LPLPTFFGQVVEERSGSSSGDADPLVWVGGSVPPLRDLQQVVTAMAPYGEIPLTLQLQLIEELDTHAPFSIAVLSQQLAAICQQAPASRLAFMPGAQEHVFLLLNAQGWQMQPWPGVAHVPDNVFAQMLFPNQPDQLDYLSAYTSDPSLIFALHGNGMNLALPVYTIFARGAALCGPVIIANENSGLTEKQVRVVQQEVFWVPDDLRPSVSALWYRAWASVTSRGWRME
jgi:hypothetical protein